MTPLHGAAANGSKEAAQILVTHGAAGDACRYTFQLVILEFDDCQRLWIGRWPQ